MNETRINALSGEIATYGALFTLTDSQKHDRALRVSVAKAHFDELGFSEELKGLRSATLTRYRNDLQRFNRLVLGQDTADLYNHPRAWEGITADLVKAYLYIMNRDGYALSTMGVALATVKRFSMWAVDHVGEKEALKIGSIKVYRKGVDAEREATRRASFDRKTRDGRTVTINRKQKDRPTPLSAEEVDALLESCEETPQGLRLRACIAIMAFHGLRVSEVSGLGCHSVSPTRLVFTRYKLAINSRFRHAEHTVDGRTWELVRPYHEIVAPVSASLFVRISKGGKVGNKPVNSSTLSNAIKAHGRKVLGVATLSAHDLRHFAAVEFTKTHYGKIDMLEGLRLRFGWTDQRTADRYLQTERTRQLGREYL